jgi:phosphoribosylanthranilate isomerase
MFVKICGITRLEDACAAVREGAHAIGFVFWPKSPRYIDPERAREIVRAIDVPVITVGVFVNQPADEINRTANKAGLSMVQLHGDETPDSLAEIERPVMKALSLEQTAVDAGSWRRGTPLLVDAHDPVKRGGTGRTADWAKAAPLARRRRVVLAGGLSAENVRDAIAQVRPFGIDVSSGVESEPGIKDGTKLTALFTALEGIVR